ncbi:hypothetical protein [Pseudomonas mosselii]|uniref:hypothetical protein n=1 Tax=Pseudomonas mosselii TaxID=78327 RepID=UPI0011AE6257|nr:hypothetical protein [Pseudomonas mosselii]
MTALQMNTDQRDASNLRLDKAPWLNKSFWAGVALAFPFYAEFFSLRWLLVGLLPFILLAFLWRRPVKFPSAAILPMVLLISLHVVALGVTDTAYAHLVIKELIIASGLLFIYFLAGEDVSKGFFAVLIPLGLVTALFGLAKAALLYRGYLIGFLLDSCGSYPAGSALCVNYNNLGFLWLVAALGCVRNRLWFGLPILIAAGALSSSRRFLVLMVFLPFVMVLLEGRAAWLRASLLVVVSTLAVYAIADSESFERFRYGKEPYSKILSFDKEKLSGSAKEELSAGASAETELSTGTGTTAEAELSLGAAADAKAESSPGAGANAIIKINRSAPSAMLGTMSDGALGAGSRLSYWKLAFSNLGLLPQGWRHHELFSCTFSSCDKFHYPHMAIMTEWLIGGFFFGLVAVAFYVWPLWVVWRQGSVIHIALLMMALPYSLISGDTVFSLPGVVASLLVALSSVPRRSL